MNPVPRIQEPMLSTEIDSTLLKHQIESIRVCKVCKLGRFFGEECTYCKALYLIDIESQERKEKEKFINRVELAHKQKSNNE